MGIFLNFRKNNDVIMIGREGTLMIYYVAFGDSLTSGVGASIESKALIHKYFSGIKKGSGCKCINLGCSGMSSDELLLYILKPDIQTIWQKATDITITIGGNDLLRTYRNNGSLAHYLITLYKLKRNMQKLLCNFRLYNRNVHVMIMGLYNPGQPEHPLYNRCNFLVQKVNSIYANLSLQHGTEFINPYCAFLHQQDLLNDNVHPNDKGYDVMAQLLIAKRQEADARDKIIENEPVPS